MIVASSSCVTDASARNVSSTATALATQTQVPAPASRLLPADDRSRCSSD